MGQASTLPNEHFPTLSPSQSRTASRVANSAGKSSAWQTDITCCRWQHRSNSSADFKFRSVTVLRSLSFNNRCSPGQIQNPTFEGYNPDFSLPTVNSSMTNRRRREAKRCPQTRSVGRRKILTAWNAMYQINNLTGDNKR